MRPSTWLAVTLGLITGAAAQASACVEVFENGSGVAGHCGPSTMAFETVGTGAHPTGPGNYVYGATGSVNLSSGTMRSSLNYQTVGMDGLQPPVRVDTRLSDTVTFFGGGAATDVTFEVTVHGAYMAQIPGSAFSGRLIFRAGGEEAWMQMSNADPAAPMAVFGKIITAVPQIEVRSNLVEDTLAVFRLTVPVTNGVPLPVSALFQIGITPMDTDITSANFADTSTLAIGMPDGWHFTSESGMLLVPEPPALALMAAGIGLLLGVSRPRSAR